MAVFQTFTAIGQAEDVSDMIANIEPYNTPVYSVSRKVTATAVHPEFQEDGLDAPAANAALEGAAAPAASATETVMLENWTQILTKTASTSGSLDTVDKYGRRTELAYQIVKKGREIARDREYASVGLAQAGGPGTIDVTGRTMKSLSVQISNDTQVASTSGATLSESDVLSVHQACYTAGGDPNMLLMNPGHAITTAGFAAAAGRMRDFANEKRLTNAVDLYVSPFGELSVVLDRWCRTTEVYLLDPAYVVTQTLRPMRSMPLAKVGDSTEVQLLEECCISLTNTRASGMVDTIQ